MLRKLLLGAGLIAGSIILTGCSNWQQVANDAIDTAYIIEANQGISQTVLQADLTEEEISIIREAETVMIELGDTLADLKSEPSKIVMLDAVIEDTASQYRLAKDVVLSNEDEYQLYDWEGLAALDSRLTEMYERYQDFKRAQNYEAAATQLGEYVKLGAKLVIIFGG